MLGTVMWLQCYSKYKVQKYGAVVEMEIVKMPGSCAGTKNRRYADCETHYPGQYVKMKYIEGGDTIISVDESLTLDYYLVALAGVAGMSSIIYYLIKGDNVPVTVIPSERFKKKRKKKHRRGL